MKRFALSLIALLYALFQVVLAVAALTKDFLIVVNRFYLQLVSLIPVQNCEFVDELYDQFTWAQAGLESLDF